MVELTKAEEQIMRVVWKKDRVFIKELIDHLPDPKPAYNTVGTFLSILEKKGFVERKKYGSSYEYTSKIKKSAYVSFVMRGFLSKYFDGSAANMISHFLKNEDLDLESYEEFQNELKRNHK